MLWFLAVAAFKIVKALLPEKAVEILKVITKKNINTYVDKDNCLSSWGGNDSYEFSFVPEVKKPAMNGAAPASPAGDYNNNFHDKKVGILRTVSILVVSNSVKCSILDLILLFELYCVVHWVLYYA